MEAGLLQLATLRDGRGGTLPEPWGRGPVGLNLQSSGMSLRKEDFHSRASLEYRDHSRDCTERAVEHKATILRHAGHRPAKTPRHKEG